jgi:predicted nucleotide-binding protein
MSVNEDRINEAQAILRGIGYTVISVKRVNDAGDQLKTKSGAVINIWDKGTISYQGNATDKIKSALAHLDVHYAEEGPGIPRIVFVVYGHDNDVREQLDAMLRRWEITPIWLDQEPSRGLTIIEKLEVNQPRASYGIVLLTPDDVGYAKDQEANKQFRARQNVVMELGMLIGSLGRRNVAVLYKGPLELPSDINGVCYIPFTKHVSEAGVRLVKELVDAGIPVDPRNL